MADRLKPWEREYQPAAQPSRLKPWERNYDTGAQTTLQMVTPPPITSGADYSNDPVMIGLSAVDKGKAGWAGRGIAAGEGGLQGATLGIADKINAFGLNVGDWAAPLPDATKYLRDQTGIPQTSLERAQQFRTDLKEQHPLSSTVGEIGGFGLATFLPMGRALKAAEAAPALITKAPGAVASGIRYGARLAGLAGLGGAENALYEGTVGVTDKAAAGELGGAEPRNEPTIGERLSAAYEGGTNPIALLAGPALSLAGRGLNKTLKGDWTTLFSKTGEKLDEPVVQEVIGKFTTDGRVSPDGLRVLKNSLDRVGVKLDGDTVRQIEVAIDDAAKSADGSAALPVRLKDVIINTLDTGDERVKNIVLSRLRAAYNVGDTASTTIRNAAKEDFPAARAYLKDQFKDILGEQPLIGREDQIVAEMQRLGKEGYEPILKAGPTTTEGAQALDDVLGIVRAPEGAVLDASPGIQKLFEPLRTIAAGEGFSLDDFVTSRPLEAAHWMQSKARQLSAKGGDEALKTAYSSLRGRLLAAINKAAPEYANIRKLYGDEYGAMEALDFGNSFFTNVKKERNVSQMKREFDALSEPQKEVARLSIRDELISKAGAGRASNAPRTEPLMSEQLQDALEEVLGEEGSKLIEQVKKVDAYVSSRKAIDTTGGSQTQQLIELAETAKDDAQTMLRRNVGRGLQKLAEAPLTAPVRASIGGLGKRIEGDPRKALDQFTALMESPIKPITREATPPIGGMPPSGATVPSTPFSQIGAGVQDVVSMGTEIPAPITRMGFDAPTLIGQAGFGSTVSGTFAKDLNGDGVVSDRERTIQALGGLIAVPLAGKQAGRIPVKTSGKFPLENMVKMSFEPPKSMAGL